MKKKVLYIDDELSLRETIGEVLELDFQGVGYRSSETGSEGIEIVKRGFIPNLVLLDLHSSGGKIEGALQTLAQLRKLAPGATVVAYTAHPGYPTQSLLSMGFDEHCDLKGSKMSLAVLRKWFQEHL